MATAASSSAYPAPPPTYAPRPKAPVRSAVPHKVVISDLTPNNIGQLRKLNSVLYPVRYGERWYKDVLHRDVKEICKFILFNDIPVGSLCCRYEREGDDKVNVYIMTLGVLAPYRRLGLASKLLEHLLFVASVGSTVSLVDPKVELPKPTKDKDGKEVKPEPKMEKRTVASLYLHVQTDNDDARALYEKHGFKLKEELQDYYRLNIQPRSAWVLERRE